MFKASVVSALLIGVVAQLVVWWSGVDGERAAASADCRERIEQQLPSGSGAAFSHLQTGTRGPTWVVTGRVGWTNTRGVATADDFECYVRPEDESFGATALLVRDEDLDEGLDGVSSD